MIIRSRDGTTIIIIVCIIIRFEVSLLRLYELADYDVRHLEVVDLETEKKHRVIHMNYTRWPDHGMPESAIPLLQVIIL